MADMTVSDVVRLAGVTHQAVYEAVKAGRLKARRKYGRWLVREADARAYAARAGVRNGHRKVEKETAE